MPAHRFISPGYYSEFTEAVKAQVIENSRTCCLPLKILDKDADHSPHLGCLAVLKVPGWEDREVWISDADDVHLGPNSKIYRNVCTETPMYLKKGIQVTLAPISIQDLVGEGKKLVNRLTEGKVNTRTRAIDRQIGTELWKIFSSLYPHQGEQSVIDFVQQIAAILKIPVPIDAIIKALHYC